MTERASQHERRDPYWHDDIAIGEGPFYRERYAIRARVHTTRERYHRHQEIIPLSAPSGERVYVHAKPYILVPDITLTIGLYRRPDPSGAIGEVQGADWSGMRHEDIGNAQAWFYPADRLAMLWECFVEGRFRQADPRQDPALHAVWQGFERFLAARFPSAERIVTPYEDIYERPVWQAFMASQGYHAFTRATFVKDIHRAC